MIKLIWLIRIILQTLVKHSNHVNILPIEYRHKNHNIFRFKMVSLKYVHKIISKLNENKFTDLDKVPPKVVKMCTNYNLFPNDM